MVIARAALILCSATLLCLPSPPGLAAPPDPRDEEIFGEPDAPATAPTSDDARDAAVLGEEDAAGSGSAGVATPDLEQRLLGLGTDRLQVGGLMLLRFNWSFTDGDELSDHPISLPNLLDVYLDARPNERVRAFVRGRLLWDPSIDESDPLSLAQGAKQTDVQLNELWLKFDIARRVFVTIGQQLIRWGASRLWNPTDVVNQTRRPVLNPFDQRNGAPLLKLHVPIESLGWNLYALGVLDEVDSLDKAGVVGRLETVFSTVELGLVGAYRDDTDPGVGLDLSAGVWDFDLTSELMLAIDERFDSGVSLGATAGIAYNVAVFDDDMFICGSEYFYNQQGTNDLDPLELFSGERQFFYAGRHYLALFATLPRPGTLDDWVFTVSGVGNLSDQSFIARFDLSVRVLTYMTVQAFVVGHFGAHGELRLGDPAFTDESRDAARAIFNPDDPTKPIPTQVLDLGIWLSVDL